MSRLLRTVFGLLITNALCVAVVVALNYSDSVWGCIRFTTSASFGVLDVSTGSYFIERPFAPASYANSVTRVPIKAGQLAYYDFKNAAGAWRSGLVDHARSFGYLGSSTDNINASLYSISPDYEYLAFNTIDPFTLAQTMTIRAASTFAEVASSRIDGLLPPRTIYTGANGVNAPDWSPSTDWFAFTTYTTTTARLTLLHLPTRTAQMIPLASAEPTAILYWSPTSTALAVIGGADERYYALYRKADVLMLNNGKWKVVYSFDTGVDRNPAIANGRIERGAWTSSGGVFSILRMQPQRNAGYELITVQLGDPAIATTIPLASTYRPAFTLNGDWYCAPDRAGTSFDLRPIADPTRAPIRTATFCGSIMNSPDGATLLVKQTTPDASSASTWIGLRVAPFSTFSLPSAELPTNLNDTQWMQWSRDSKLVLFMLPIEQTTQDPFDGYLVVIDTTTGRWIKTQQPIAMNLYPAIAPDSTRLAVWSADHRRVFVLDLDHQLVAEINSTFINPNSILLDWNPDGTRLLMSEAYYRGRSNVSIFDRDGQPLITFPRPAPSQTWLVNSAEKSWTHCEPSPKLPRLNLPQ